MENVSKITAVWLEKIPTLLATTSRGLEAKSGEMEWNSAACCAMVYPHASDTSSTYSTAARRCASAVMLCGSTMIRTSGSKTFRCYSQHMQRSRCAAASWHHGQQTRSGASPDHALPSP